MTMAPGTTNKRGRRKDGMDTSEKILHFDEKSTSIQNQAINIAETIKQIAKTQDVKSSNNYGESERVGDTVSDGSAGDVDLEGRNFNGRNNTGEIVDSDNPHPKDVGLLEIAAISTGLCRAMPIMYNISELRRSSGFDNNQLQLDKDEEYVNDKNADQLSTIEELEELNWKRIMMISLLLFICLAGGVLLSVTVYKIAIKFHEL